MKKMSSIYKCFIVIGFLFFFNKGIFSQAIGLEGKRFSTDISIGESVFNKYYLFVTGDFPSSSESIYSSSYVPAFRFNGSFNYTIGRKSSVGILLSGSLNSFKDAVSSSEYYDEKGYKFSVGKITYYGIGLKYSLFSSNFISPVGSSISLYAKYNVVKSKEIIYVKGYDEMSGNYTLGSSSLKMAYYNIGVSWGKMSFLSNKIPLYLKYGASVGITVKRNYYMGEEEEKYSKEEMESSIYSINNETNFSHFTTYFNLFEAVQLHLGLGYIF